ncbi:MAG TPA: alpha/beta hydrolase, partial [Vicinamibacterales bacterium]
MTPARTTNRVAVVAAILGLAIGLRPHTVPFVQVVLPASAAQALHPTAHRTRGGDPGFAQAGRTAGPSARRDFANLPGVRLWFTDTGGNGEPVVLMHPNTGTSEVWEPQTAAFSKAGYRVIAFDRRGWGRSEADPATGAQPGHASEDLHSLADYLLLRRFHLV